MKFRVNAVYISFVIVLPFVFGLMNCARESRPMGGAKDTLAPKVIQTKPYNGSVNVYPSRITIFFNENIDLNNVQQNCIISPVFEENPDIMLRRKKIVISVPTQELVDNTTYTFNFAQAIQDRNEGNILEKYVYAFSTGNEIDSLQIAGKVHNTVQHTLPEDVFVVLYQDTADSAFYSQRPMYITRVNTSGEYKFTNLRAGTYSMYAIADKNNDYMFNLPSEQIAFLDSVITPSVEVVSDTLVVSDSLDSLSLDSVHIVQKQIFQPDSVMLYLFDNKNRSQSITNFERLSPYLVSCGFADTFNMSNMQVTIPGYQSSQDYTLESIDNDSLLVWLVDSSLIYADSISMQVVVENNMSEFTDTIVFFSAKELPKHLVCSVDGRSPISVLPGDSVLFSTNRPVDYFTDSVFVFEKHDTVAYTNRNGKIVDSVEIMQLNQHQHVGKKSSERTDYYYENQKIINQTKGDSRFALYFAKKLHSPQNVSLELQQYPEKKNWYVSEYDEQTNSLLCWITDEEVATLKNPELIVEYEHNHQQEISFSSIYTPDETFRTARFPELVLHIADQQKESLHIDEPIEIVLNNPVRTIVDSLFMMYKSDDTTHQNCITRVVMHP
ncbi:MAG: Ig-like domain-containing domain, partial [Bacteroidales bacterium]